MGGSAPGLGPVERSQCSSIPVQSVQEECERHADDLNSFELTVARMERASGGARDVYSCFPCRIDPRPELRARTLRKDSEQCPQDPLAPQALYRLGILQADPTNPWKDYRAARVTFTRSLTEYPRSPWDADARAWQATLTDPLLREDESASASERLKRTSCELEQASSALSRVILRASVDGRPCVVLWRCSWQLPGSCASP